MRNEEACQQRPNTGSKTLPVLPIFRPMCRVCDSWGVLPPFFGPVTCQFMSAHVHLVYMCKTRKTQMFKRQRRFEFSEFGFLGSSVRVVQGLVEPPQLPCWSQGLPAQECSSNEQICLNDVMSGGFAWSLHGRAHGKPFMELETI